MKSIETINYDAYFNQIFEKELEVISNNFLAFKEDNDDLLDDVALNKFETMTYAEYSKEYKFIEANGSLFENPLITETIHFYNGIKNLYKSNYIHNFIKNDLDEIFKTSKQKFKLYQNEYQIKVPNADLLDSLDLKKLIAILAKNVAFKTFGNQIRIPENINKVGKRKNELPSNVDAAIIMFYILKELNYKFEEHGNKIKIQRLLEYLTGSEYKNFESLIYDPLSNKHGKGISENKTKKLVNKLIDMKFNVAANLLINDSEN